jgi:hypothetical protein
MGEAYVRQLKDLASAMARHTAEIKKIREKQKEAKARLAEWMERNSHDEYHGYKLSKIKPKPKVPKKTQKDKKRDAIHLFNEIGVPDPNDFWDRFQETQKYIPPEDESKEG